MMLLTALFVAIAFGKSSRIGRRPGRGGRGGNRNNACSGLDNEVAQDLLVGTDGGVLTTLQTGTMYCTLNARYEEWPACPSVAVDTAVEETPEQRRHLRKGGLPSGLTRYNNARFTMASGSSTFVQVEDNSASDSTTQCYQDDELKFTVDGVLLDSTTDVLGRRLLKRGGGSTATATVQITQAGTADFACDIAHTLTCSIPRTGLQANDGMCVSTAVVCESPRDSDTKVKVTCYTEEDSLPSKWSDVESCTEGATEESGNQAIVRDVIAP